MQTWDPRPGEQLRGVYREDGDGASIESEDGTRWAIPEDAQLRVGELQPRDGAEILLVFQGRDPHDGLGLYNVALPTGGSESAA